MSPIKTKIFIWLVIARVFDLLSTFISKGGSLNYETNFLVRKYHLGWFSLITFNIIILILFYFILRFQTDKHFLIFENKINHNVKNFGQYLSLIYYGKIVTKKQFFLSAKINYIIFLHSFIPIFFVTLIITRADSSHKCNFFLIY